MRAMKKFCQFILAVTLVSPVALYAAETAGQYLDDTTITSKVIAKLATDSRVPASAIKVNTYKGHAQLCGFVDNQDQAKAAEEVAKTVDGVADVYNDVQVKATDKERSAAQDTAITTKVKAKLMATKGISSTDVSVETFNNVVQLCGFVDTADEARKAANVSRSVKNVGKVQNNLRVKGEV